MDQEKMYVDMTLTNSAQTTSNQRIPINFNQTRTKPILSNSGDYYIAITRFVVNTQTLPIFQPIMLDKSTNKTIYSITMEYNGTIKQQYMQFTPQILNPVDPDESSYVFTYAFVMEMFNKCLSDCFNQLQSVATLPTTNIPTFTYDVQTKLFTLHLDKSNYGYNESNKINIYFNYAFYNLIASINCINCNKNKLGQDYQLQPLSNVMIQEYSTTAILNPISSLVFGTTLIPVYPATTFPIMIYVNGSTSQTSSSQYVNQLTDFIANELDFTPYVQYSANVYRYIPLQNQSIINVDVQLYWLNKHTGVYKPVYLASGGSASLKMMFSKKSTSSN